MRAQKNSSIVQSFSLQLTGSALFFFLPRLAWFILTLQSSSTPWDIMARKKKLIRKNYPCIGLASFVSRQLNIVRYEPRVLRSHRDFYLFSLFFLFLPSLSFISFQTHASRMPFSSWACRNSFQHVSEPYQDQEKPYGLCLQFWLYLSSTRTIGLFYV